MSLTDGMDFEAGATGRDIAQVQRAPLERRLIMAPIGLVAAEVGAQLGVYAENLLAGFFADTDKKKKKPDESWRTKVLLGKVVLAVLLYPVSAPVALGFSASGGIMHWLIGVPTFAECEDQANRRGKQLLKLGEKPKGRYTRKPNGKEDDNHDSEEEPEKDDKGDKEPAQADVGNIDLAAKLTDPDVLHTYGKAAELAFERLVQQGHLPPGTKPVLNEALVQEVQNLVRDAQNKAA